MIVCVTGIQLNHIDTLAWDQKPVQSRWLLSVYGVEPPPLLSVDLDGVWYSDIGEGTLYREDKPFVNCSGQLVGAALWSSWQVVACSHEVLLVTQEGQLIERLSSADALPVPIDAVAQCASHVCLEREGVWLSFDLDTLQATERNLRPESVSKPLLPPAELLQKLQAAQSVGAITWERVVLDLHSGRLFGLGPWLMDLVALALIILSFSGIWLWASGVSKRWHRRNH